MTPAIKNNLKLTTFQYKETKQLRSFLDDLKSCMPFSPQMLDASLVMLDHYFACLSDKERDEFLSEMPDFLIYEEKAILSRPKYVTVLEMVENILQGDEDNLPTTYRNKHKLMISSIVYFQVLNKYMKSDELEELLHLQLK